jgi:S-adenosylmethionine:tRNA ribosyltransferase-isomerase
LRQKGVIITSVILHVGLGTFRPVKADNIDEHKMHSEYYEIPEQTAKEIIEAKKRGNKIFAAGTTSCRTLEGSFEKNSQICADSGYTDIFIYPGKNFNVVDSLITNFHLPESTLIMLVCAKYGYDNTMRAYSHAIENKYRFFSFGDAMLLL